MTTRLPAASSETVNRYLSRLGLAASPAPTAAGLAELQRRHLDAVPYENLAIMLGRPAPTDPRQTLERISAGGNALRDPVEVAAGEIRQCPLRYQITGVGADGEWTFWHDPAARSFPAVDVSAARPSDAQVAAAHRVLSTPPDGRFTRVLVVQRRDDTGTEVLRGIRHQRAGDGAFTRDLASYDDWRAVLGSLGVSLAGVTGPELWSLHARMLAAHAEWAAADGARA